MLRDEAKRRNLWIAEPPQPAPVTKEEVHAAEQATRRLFNFS